LKDEEMANRHLMKTFAVGVLSVFASTLSASSSAIALSIDEARHILARTGFGAAPHEMAALQPLSREQAVNKIVNSLQTKPVTKPPAFLKLPRPNYMDKDASKTEVVFARLNEVSQLQNWWLDEMISTPSPFTEKLVLFWHNHFVSQHQVNNYHVSAPLYDQLQLFRDTGTTNFRELLHGIVKDPMMLTYLDNIRSTQKDPNENLARELLELFTLGIGHYSETDINELARILAGHTIDANHNWRYRVREDWQDQRVKTFLGKTGAHTAEDAIEMLLQQEQVSRFLTTKFYREFIAPEPDPQAVERLAKVWRDNNYAMKPFLKALLMSDQFWAPQNRGTLVKSPIDLIVGYARTFGLWTPDITILNDYSNALGQSLLNPPNVAGWTGGTYWINTNTLSKRRTVINRLWAMREVAINHLKNVDPNDLLVRFSSEYESNPVQYEIKVNDQVVARGEAKYGALSPNEGSSNNADYLKPTWELARVPRKQLPQTINTVTVTFLNDPPCDGSSNRAVNTCKHKGESNLFVNWVQVDQKRANVYHATQVFPKRDCTDRVPKGMLYFAGYLTFNFVDLAGNPKKSKPALADIQTPLNSLIEYGSSRIPLRMHPANRVPESITTPLTQEFTAINAVPFNQEETIASVLAIQPMNPNHRDQSADMAVLLRTLTHDPAYNLK
jgi:uncharacterized protein (DUF1800 family)